MPRKIIAPAVALALAFGATAAAVAAPADQTSTRVQIADLNLQSPADAQVALQRLRHAARAICGVDSGDRDLNRKALSEACIRDAVDATVASARSPVLAAANGTPMVTPTLVAAAN